MPRLESPCRQYRVVRWFLLPEGELQLRQYRVVRWFLLPEGELQLRQATVGSGLQIHCNCGCVTC